MARPSLLVGHFPLTGAGRNDVYEIYGNFFWQNPTEALFQGEGNIALYDNVFVNDFDGLEVASTHGAPWRYDTFVPVVFAGAGLKTATVNRPVTPYDIAPTLSAFLGVKPPSGAVGEPLSEVLADQN